MNQPVTGRADLIRFWKQQSLHQTQAGDSGSQEQIDANNFSHVIAAAAALDFEFSPDDRQLKKSGKSEQKSITASQRSSDSFTPTQFLPAPPRYSRLIHFESRETEDEAEQQRIVEQYRSGDAIWHNRPKVPAVFELLASEQEFLTRFRKVSGRQIHTRAVDVRELCHRFSTGQHLRRLPFKRRRTWGNALHVIQDRSSRLTPYWQDEDFVCDILKKIFPVYNLTISRLHDSGSAPWVLFPKSASPLDWKHPPADTLILALTDLGGLHRDRDDQPDPLSFWKHFTDRCRATGNRTLVLSPCLPHELPDDLVPHWTVIPWETPSARTTSSQNALEQLKRLAAACVRLEPGLLREIRRYVLDGGQGNPGLEARFWDSDCLSSVHSVAATTDSRHQGRLRRSLTDSDIAQDILPLLRAWRSSLHEAVYYEELISLPGHLPDEFQEDLHAAYSYFQEITDQAFEDITAFPNPLQFKSWARGVIRRVPPEKLRSRQLKSSLERLRQLVEEPGEAPLNSGVDPVNRPTQHDDIITLQITQRGNQYIIHQPLEQLIGGYVGSIRTKNRELLLRNSIPPLPDRSVTMETAEQWHSFPDWATRYGTDGSTPWAELEIGNAVQRFRWIPSGQFFVGSPEAEEGRDDDEGPQQEVKLSCGFWLFDTPCTQSFYAAVTGSHPSDFKGEDRPVDQVSWHDAQSFVRALNEQVPGLALRLPTEAEWEYACRAGTSGSRYGELDEIAWYEGNGGGETHSVKQKEANGWGLYDMLGNVWEWCQDHSYRKYTVESVTDPLYETGDSDAARVIRGGSWDYSARGARAAYRYGFRPDNDWGFQGFRCLSSTPGPRWGDGRQGFPKAERREPDGQEPQRGEIFFLRQPDQIAVKRINWEPGQSPATVPVASFTPLLTVETDIEWIGVVSAEPPAWAEQSGHDPLGLWAELKIAGAVQRFRWIPPGQFLMGSPEPEEDRRENEGPQHEVTLSNGFWLFDTPCTQGFYAAVKGKNPSRFEGEDRPVDQVSWHDAQSFVRALNEQVPGLDLRLPTEAEWEYACRAGTSGSRYGELDEIAWYNENSGRKTHSVKQKQANLWGLYDMLGNVDEWCQDHAYREYAVEAVTDPLYETGDDNASRVIRGGSCDFSAGNARAAARVGNHPDYDWDFQGFRCLSSPSGPL